MIKSSGSKLTELPDSLYITDELYTRWQSESHAVELHESVTNAIKALRKRFTILEKEDNNRLRYYISDRRWRKAYRLMQTSAYLNGRNEINLTDFLLLIHCFWNDVEIIPNVLEAFTSGISESIVKQINRIDKSIRQIMTPNNNPPVPKPSRANITADGFAEYDYFYYLVENFPDGDTYFTKWDYASLTNKPRDGIKYFDSKRRKTIIHTLIPGKPFEMESQHASNIIKVKIQKCQNGVIIDGTPYSFKRRPVATQNIDSVQNIPLYQRITAIQDTFKLCVENWENLITTNWINYDNLFLSPADIALVNKMIKEVCELIKATEVKINNVMLMIK